MNKIKKVKEIHKYDICQIKDGRFKTTYYEDGKRKQITAYTKNMLYEKLFDQVYFPNGINAGRTFQSIFEEMCEHAIEYGKVRPKTVREWENDYKRFYSDSELEMKVLSEISLSDICKFLDECHKEPIQKQRHDSIKTIYKKVLSYSARYLDNYVPNLFEALDYREWKWVQPEQRDYYDEEDRAKILHYLDSLTEPMLRDLMVETIFELGLRNGEVRALRFDDFNLEDGYVRISAMACGRHREERVKKDSYAGIRTLALSKRMKRIYHKAKELSWSDEYLFVAPQDYCVGEEILLSEDSVGRALRKACNAVGVDYLPPHQIRFSNVTQMIKDGCPAKEVQKMAGHTTFTMTEHYIRDYLRNVPVATVDNDRILREQGYITDFEEECTQGYTDPDEMKKASNA